MMRKIPMVPTPARATAERTRLTWHPCTAELIERYGEAGLIIDSVETFAVNAQGVQLTEEPRRNCSPFKIPKICSGGDYICSVMESIRMIMLSAVF